MGKGIITTHKGDGLYSVRLMYDTERLDAMISGIEEQFQANQEKIDDAESGISDLEDDIQESDDKIDSLKSEAVSLGNDLDTLYDDAERLNSDIYDLQLEIADLEVRIDQAESGSAYQNWLIAQKTQKEEELSGLQSELSAKNAEIQKKQNQIAGKQEEIRQESLEISEKKAEMKRIRIQKAMLELANKGIEKRISTLQNAPREKKTVAWCADLSTELSGEVGIIEVARSRENGVNIRPGFPEDSAYQESRDGMLQAVLGNTPAGSLYNFILQPSAQKYLPRYRYAEILSIKTGDKAKIRLDPLTGHQGIGINQDDTLDDVPITYMNCNSIAFQERDKVLVKFVGQDFSRPEIIGFKEGPKPCDTVYLFVYFSNVYIEDTNEFANYAIVWDLGLDDFAEIPDDEGNVVVEWPVDRTNISNWYENLSEKITMEGGNDGLFTISEAASFGRYWQTGGQLSCGETAEDKYAEMTSDWQSHHPGDPLPDDWAETLSESYGPPGCYNFCTEVSPSIEIYCESGDAIGDIKQYFHDTNIDEKFAIYYYAQYIYPPFDMLSECFGSWWYFPENNCQAEKQAGYAFLRTKFRNTYNYQLTNCDSYGYGYSSQRSKTGSHQYTMATPWGDMMQWETPYVYSENESPVIGSVIEQEVTVPLNPISVQIGGRSDIASFVFLSCKQRLYKKTTASGETTTEYDGAVFGCVIAAGFSYDSKDTVNPFTLPTKTKLMAICNAYSKAKNAQCNWMHMRIPKSV